MDAELNLYAVSVVLARKTSERPSIRHELAIVRESTSEKAEARAVLAAVRSHRGFSLYSIATAPIPE